MKIGIVLPGFSADDHDWCIPALYNFVRSLGTQNEIHVFALEYPYHRGQYNFFGAQVYALGGAHRGKLYAPRLWSDALSAIFAEHRRARFDLLHAFWVNKPGVIGGIAARVFGVPFIASVVGGELVALPQIAYGGQRNRLERAMIDWVMKRADCVTVGSRYLQKIGSKWRTDVQVVPLGVDTQLFSAQSDVSTPEIRILNVGSLNLVKNHELLLDTFSRLDSSARLEIVGAGMQEKFLRTRVSELGFSERVRFLGEVAHDALLQKYHAADLFVQSSLYEAQGMALLEAAASGTAIAGTPVGVVPELAERGGAIVADGFDCQALTNAIHRAIEQRKELGCRARAIAEKEFSVEGTCERWGNLYNSVRTRQ